MQRLAFYFAYPFILLIASLPTRALYKVSDFLCYLLRVSGYRREVIEENLRNSFPVKSDAEIKAISKAYYRYLCDLILETLKTLTMTEEEARERCVCHREEWMDNLYRENKSFVIVMGHYGNWEWAGPSFSLNIRHQLVVIYRPLSNPYFERMMVGMRTRFGTSITPVSQTLRGMVANRQKITATAFVADQAAPQDTSCWATFLNQDTSVFTGPEKLAKKFNYPVVYINLRRPRRGYYDMYFELMFPNPRDTADGEISEAFMKRLEKEIISDPVPWLWSHRRWKHSRKTS